MKLNIKTSIQYEDQLPGAEFPRNMALMHVRNVGIRLGRSLASCIANRGGAVTGVKRYAPAGSSPDQAFLATATELAGPSGRVGMVMKSTPFFSKDIHAVESRAAILKRLAPTALINLSDLSADSGAAASALDCVAESAARPSSGGGMPPRAYCGGDS